MGRHAAKKNTSVNIIGRSPTQLRNLVLAMLGLTIFVVAMIASYSGAFANPTLHHLEVAVAGPPQVLDAIRGQDALAVTQVGDDAAARQSVYERKADAAFAVTPDGHLTIYVAGGGGRSVVTAAESAGRAIASDAGLGVTVIDVARTSPADPSGTVEFYAIIFLSIGASVGAAVLGRIMGAVRKPATLALRTISLAGYSALLATAVAVYATTIVGALPGHAWELFAALWLYAMAVGGAVTGVAAAFGALTSMALTLFLVVVGNAAAGGPVGLPLLSGFYATFNGIVPQGSGVALLRSLQYFGGHGAQTPLVTLVLWAGVGCLLAVLATVVNFARPTPRSVRLNYRASHDGFTLGGNRAVLRPRVLSPAD